MIPADGTRPAGLRGGLVLLVGWNRVQGRAVWRRMSRDRKSLAFSIGAWVMLFAVVTVVFGKNLAEILLGLIEAGNLVVALAAGACLLLAGAWLGQVEAFRQQRLSRYGPLRGLGVSSAAIAAWAGLVCGLRALGSYALPVIMTLYFGFPLLLGFILILACGVLTMIGALLGALSSPRIRVVRRDGGARPEEEATRVQRLARWLLPVPDFWQASLRMTADAAPNSLRLLVSFLMALVLSLLIGIFLAGPDALLVRSLLLLLAGHLVFCSLSANLESVVRLGRGTRMPIGLLVRDTLFPPMVLSLLVFFAGMLVAVPWFSGQLITTLAGAMVLVSLNLIYHGGRLLDGLDHKDSWRVQYAVGLTLLVILLFVFGPLAPFLIVAIQLHRYRTAEYRSLEYA